MRWLAFALLLGLALTSAPAIAQVSVGDAKLIAFEQRSHEIAYLKHQRPPLFMPIALTATGGATLVVGLAFSALALGIEAWGTKESFREQASELRPFWIAAGVGAVLTAGGVVWLVSTVKRRRAINLRILELNGHGAASPAGLNGHAGASSALATW